jgi:hypothetical protein
MRMVRRGVAVAVLACSIVSVLMLTPLAGGQQERVAAGCALSDLQPGQPLELNAVRARGLGKFVAMEKEIFHCTGSTGRFEEVKDVETFVELVKKRDGATVDRRVDVIGCGKNLRTGVVRCNATELPLTAMPRPVEGCSLIRGEYPFEAIRQPTDPVEMETLVLGGTAITVKVEKEILQCPGGLADVYLFAEVDEALVKVRDRSGSATRTLAPFARHFSGVICFKDLANATVARCRVFEAA